MIRTLALYATNQSIKKAPFANCMSERPDKPSVMSAICSDRERASGLPPTTFMECHGEAHLGKGQVGFVDFMVRPIFNELQRHLPELELQVKMLDENRQKWADVGVGKIPMLGNEEGEDDDLIAWSANVGCLALGPSNPTMLDAKPVTVLMTDAGKADPAKLLLSPPKVRSAAWFDDTSGKTTQLPIGPGVWV